MVKPIRSAAIGEIYGSKLRSCGTGPQTTTGKPDNMTELLKIVDIYSAGTR